jgi:hypothetical protein
MSTMKFSLVADFCKERLKNPPEEQKPDLSTRKTGLVNKKYR